MTDGASDEHGADAAWRSRFVECLERHRPAGPLIEEALAIKQKHLPRQIYKYRQICRNHLGNLETNTIWLSSPEKYNDPYDCWLTLPDGVVGALVLNRIVDELVSAYHLDAIVPTDVIEGARRADEPVSAVVALIQKHSNHLKVESLTERVRDYCAQLKRWSEQRVVDEIRTWRKVMQLGSFSAVKDSLLMWSHYADHHRGFCVEFDLQSLNADHPLCRELYPVIYSDKLYDLRPYVEQLVKKDRQDLNHFYPHLCVLHKFLGWEYEQEWRVVKVREAEALGNNLAVPIPSRVFLGARFDDASGGELLRICHERRIEIMRMRLGDVRFGLLPEPFAGL